jgi:hypothetical protein
MSELKKIFKPLFAKGLTAGDGESLSIESFDRGVVGQFVGLYGLDELFESLPDTLTSSKTLTLAAESFVLYECK